MKSSPRIIDPAQTFDALVKWFEFCFREHQAPGFLVGLSGTDSLVAFCAAATASIKANKAHRVLGVHFAPSEDFLYDHPEAKEHLWFVSDIIPWLNRKFPGVEIVVDTSIDWRADGQRWGALMDLSVVSNKKKRELRLPEDRYWVVGTRNLTEDKLYNYSNASIAVSLQPLIHLWKSEIIKIAEYLAVPSSAIVKSCETDCICGRMRLAAQHITELDQLLMVKFGELSPNYVNTIPESLRLQLIGFINTQLVTNSFKTIIPYKPNKNSVIKEFTFNDSLVQSFEDGSLSLFGPNGLSHRKHLHIAWVYLKNLSFEDALERHNKHLSRIFETVNASQVFNLELTRQYFVRIDEAMKIYPTENFDELAEKAPEILVKFPKPQ